jgi:hypothetical protein
MNHLVFNLYTNLTYSNRITDPLQAALSHLYTTRLADEIYANKQYDFDGLVLPQYKSYIERKAYEKLVRMMNFQFPYVNAPLILEGDNWRHSLERNMALRPLQRHYLRAQEIRNWYADAIARADHEYTNLTEGQAYKYQNLAIYPKAMPTPKLRHYNLIWVYLVTNQQDLLESADVIPKAAVELEEGAHSIDGSFQMTSFQVMIYQTQPSLEFIPVHDLMQKAAIAASPRLLTIRAVHLWLLELINWLQLNFNNQINVRELNTDEMDWDRQSYPKPDALFNMIMNLLGNNIPNYFYHFVLDCQGFTDQRPHVLKSIVTNNYVPPLPQRVTVTKPKRKR